MRLGKKVFESKKIGSMLSWVQVNNFSTKIKTDITRFDICQVSILKKCQKINK